MPGNRIVFNTDEAVLGSDEHRNQTQSLVKTTRFGKEVREPRQER